MLVLNINKTGTSYQTTLTGDGTVIHKLHEELNDVIKYIHSKQPERISISKKLNINTELLKHGIKIDGDIVNYLSKEQSLQLLDKYIEESNVFELIVKSDDFINLARILIENDYLVDHNQLENNKVRVIASLLQ